MRSGVLGAAILFASFAGDAIGQQPNFSSESQIVVLHVAVRHVDAGSCNGCEHELTLVSSPYYDLQRFGLGIVASPRHADVLLVTGPVTTRMRDPLLVAYNAMPEPRLVAALGDCALGCNLLGLPENAIGSVERILPVAIRIPGCPPTPDVIAAALLALRALPVAADGLQIEAAPRLGAALEAVPVRDGVDLWWYLRYRFQ